MDWSEFKKQFEEASMLHHGGDRGMVNHWREDGDKLYLRQNAEESDLVDDVDTVIVRHPNALPDKTKLYIVQWPKTWKATIVSEGATAFFVLFYGWQ